jgi:hypothetical protein
MAKHVATNYINIKIKLKHLEKLLRKTGFSTEIEYPLIALASRLLLKPGSKQPEFTIHPSVSRQDHAVLQL